MNRAEIVMVATVAGFPLEGGASRTRTGDLLGAIQAVDHVPAQDGPVAPDGYKTGTVSSGTNGHVRPLRALKNCSVSSENLPARAREWTRVRYSSFPRDEGVPGSSPGVGFLRFAGILCPGHGP
jgi:hypothetical protein